MNVLIFGVGRRSGDGRPASVVREFKFSQNGNETASSNGFRKEHLRLHDDSQAFARRHFQRFAVVAPDIRGFGDSAEPEHTLELYATQRICWRCSARPASSAPALSAMTSAGP
jgi:hypothetical protein